MKIKDRESAGNILAGSVQDTIKKMERPDIIVIGLPRGGFVIAEIIAKKLSCKLYMLLVKRLRAPYNEEMAIGAVAGDGSSYLNKSLIKELKISDEYINNELSYQLKEIKRQADMYEEKKNSLNEKDITVDGKTIIIVDDGAATGSTMLATVTSLRNKYNPKSIIVAVAVSPRDPVDLLRREGIDHVEVIICPTNNKFRSIEQFYQHFDQVSDKQILDIVSTLKK